MVNFSLRLGVTLYLDYPSGDISILRSLYEVDAAPTRLSLREKAALLRRFIQARKDLIEFWQIDLRRNGDNSFGNFRSSVGRNRSFPRMASGLLALKERALLQDTRIREISPLETRDAPYQEMPSANFPARVEDWIVAEVHKHRDPGTEAHIPQRDDGDKQLEYDFWMKEILSFLFVFKDDRDLLTDRAAEHLIHGGMLPLMGQRRFMTYRVTAAGWLRAIGWVLIIGGAALAFALQAFGVGALLAAGVATAAAIIKAIRSGLRYPETENHVLMTHASIYLANQFARENSRGIGAFNAAPYSELDLNNAGGPVETIVLAAAGRIVHADFFETNSRNYRAFSCQALMLLASHAGSSAVALAARNAMDFAALKFACQSIRSQSYAPFRRNYKVSDTEGLYTSNSFLRMMGALTGEVPWDHPSFDVLPGDRVLSSSDGGRPDAREKWEPGARFAFWACALGYRVPHVLLDVISSDTPPERRAQGYWVQSQARFSNEHYKEGNEPRYFNADGTIFSHNATFKSTPELYFRAPQFLNSWGGSFDRYEVRFDRLLAAAEGNNPDGTHEYDRVSRLTVLLHGQPPYPNWDDDPAQVSAAALHTQPGKMWDAKTGCFKGLTYAIGRDRDSKPINVPWHRRSEEVLFSGDQAFAMVLDFYDLSAENEEQNPRHGVYVVVGELQKADASEMRALGRGFWEIAPEERFPNVDRLRAATRTANVNFASASDFVAYSMSNGDVVRLSLEFPNKSDRAFSRIVTAAGEDWPDDIHAALQQRHGFPLINVLEVDRDYQFNGHRLAFSAGQGEVSITNRFANVRLTLNCTDFRQPQRTVGLLA